MATIKAEPDFDGLRADGRFQYLLKRIGLFEEGAAPAASSPDMSQPR